MNSEFSAVKDVGGPQPPIHLAPSEILCFECTERHRTEDYVFDADGQQEARLAAVEVGGRWFALDGARLEYYQRLERDGNCRKLTVEPVPATQLSEETRSKIAGTLASDRNNAMSLNDPLIRGYENLDEDRNSSNAMLDSVTAAIDTDDDPDSSNSSSSDDGDDSSSECGSHYLDWSEDEGDSSEDESEDEDDDDDDDSSSSHGRKQHPSADGSHGDDNQQLLLLGAAAAAAADDDDDGES